MKRAPLVSRALCLAFVFLEGYAYVSYVTGTELTQSDAVWFRDQSGLCGLIVAAYRAQQAAPVWSWSPGGGDVPTDPIHQYTTTFDNGRAIAQ